jgi:archaellum component FlaD/FlaE
MSGWIKLHRQITDWEWYDDHNTFRLFMHLLLKANHKERSYRGVKIEVGCIMTGRELLSKETGLSVQQIRTCLERLKSTNEITIKSNKQGTIIQVVKYKDYQVTTNESTTNQPTSNQQVTTNKNVKKEKNDNNTFTPPSAIEVLDYCIERKNFVNAETFIDFYESKGWMVGRNKMKDWKACVRTWEKSNTEQPKQEIEDHFMNHVMKQINLNK